MAMDAGLWSPRRPHADSRLRAAARGRDGDRINAVLAAAGYNVGAWRQLQLMDGWQASEAWRADLRAEYILSEAGGRGRRRCGVGREEDSDQRCQDRCPIGRCQNGRRVTPSPRGCQQHDFLFPKFFPKKFGQKIGAGPPMEDFGIRKSAGPVLFPTPPTSGNSQITPAGPFPAARFSG